MNIDTFLQYYFKNFNLENDFSYDYVTCRHICNNCGYKIDDFNITEKNRYCCLTRCCPNCQKEFYEWLHKKLSCGIDLGRLMYFINKSRKYYNKTTKIQNDTTESEV